MERAKLSDKVPASSYVAAPIESKLEPAPRRAAVGRRPAARPDARVGQRRRGDARPSTSAARARAFVRLMNRRARELGLDEHALREPDRARRARQLLLRARPRAARGARCAATASSARSPTARRRRSRTGDRPRTVRNRNTLLDQDRWRQRAQDRPHAATAGLRAGRHAHAPRRHARLGRARHAARWPRATTTRSRCCSWGAGAVPSGSTRSRAGTVVGTPEIRLPPRRDAARS